MKIITQTFNKENRYEIFMLQFNYILPEQDKYMETLDEVSLKLLCKVICGELRSLADYLDAVKQSGKMSSKKMNKKTKK